MKPKIAVFTVKHISHIYPIIGILKNINKWANLTCYIDENNENIFKKNNLKYIPYSVDLGNTDYSKAAEVELEKFAIQLAKQNYKEAHFHSLKRDLISSHTINKEYFYHLLNKFKKENYDLIIRDNVDVYGAEIAKRLNIKTVGYITNNLYNEEYFKTHEEELNIYLATLSIKEELGKDYYKNFFRRVKKLNDEIEDSLDAIHVDCYHNYLLNDNFNLIYSTNLLQPKEAMPKNNEKDYLIVYPDSGKFKIENEIPTKLKTFINDSKYIIYISTGSFHSENIRFYQAIIDFFAGSKFHLVISCIKWDKEIKEYVTKLNLTHQIYVDSFIPQKYVLSKADLFISSGGFNSILESIYYKVPMIIRPVSCEQRMNGLIIEKNGLGVTLYKSSKKDLREEVYFLMNNEKVKNNLEIHSNDLKKHTKDLYIPISENIRRILND